jgi:hypothetical protein
MLRRVDLVRATRRNILEDGIHHSHRHEHFSRLGSVAEK